MKFTWKKTMKNFTQYSIDFKEYKKYVGLPFFEILNKLLIKKEDFKKIRDQYQRNSLSYQKNVKLFSGARKLLNYLNKSYKVALFTSKDKYRTNFLIKKFKLEFDFIITGNDVKKGKPNPEGLNKIIKKLRFRKNLIYYVGDTRFDYECSKKSKVKYIHVNWGFEKIKKNNNVVSVNNFNELKKLLI